jgi:putative transposase
MKKSRFTEDQIIGVLKEHQAGIPTAELCRKHGIPDATFYNWRSRYGGMEVSDARRLKSLEDENRRLKKLLAESMLDVATLKEARESSDARDKEALRDLGDRREVLLAAARLRFGYRRLHILLRREGIELNHKKLFRL